MTNGPWTRVKRGFNTFNRLPDSSLSEQRMFRKALLDAPEPGRRRFVQFRRVRKCVGEKMFSFGESGRASGKFGAVSERRKVSRGRFVQFWTVGNRVREEMFASGASEIASGKKCSVSERRKSARGTVSGLGRRRTFSGVRTPEWNGREERKARKGWSGGQISPEESLTAGPRPQRLRKERRARCSPGMSRA